MRLALKIEHIGLVHRCVRVGNHAGKIVEFNVKMIGPAWLEKTDNLLPLSKETNGIEFNTAYPFQVFPLEAPQ